MLTRSVALLSVAVAGIASALNAPLPLPTDNIANAVGLELGYSPKPTAAPIVPRDVFKRQSGTGSQIGWAAKDNTCGYVSGNSASVKTCDAPELCAAVLVAGVASMGCCDSTFQSCEFLGNCVGSVGYYSSSLCDAACQADINTLKCTAASQPYCYSYLVPGSMTMGFYSCASTYSASFARFETTYAGEVDVRTWSPVYDTATGAGAQTAVPFIKTATLANSYGFTNVPSSQTNSAAGAASTGTSTSSHSTVKPSKKKSSPMGAIAGGVVGGLAILALGIFALVFLLLKKKKATAAGTAGAGTPAYPQQQQQQQQAGMVQQPQGYDPNQQYYQGQYAPPPQQGAYPPGQDPHVSYFAPGATNDGNGYAPVGGYPSMDATKRGLMEQVNSVPPSPAPVYNPTVGPSPVGTPQPGMYEAPAQNGGYQASPTMGVATPVGQQQGQQQMHHQQQMQAAPVELENTYAYPTHNTEGRPVFEAQ